MICGIHPPPTADSRQSTADRPTANINVVCVDAHNLTRQSIHERDAPCGMNNNNIPSMDIEDLQPYEIIGAPLLVVVVVVVVVRRRRAARRKKQGEDFGFLC